MNKQPAFCSKQSNTHFTVRRQTMLTLVSNSRNFYSASPSFRLSDCKHTGFFSICVENTLKTRLETKELNRSARRPMPLHKGTPQRRARRLQRWVLFNEATHHNTTPIHLLFWFQKAFHTPNSRHVAQQLATTRNGCVQGRMPNWNPFTNSPWHKPKPKINRRGTSGFSKDPMKRRRRNHRNLPIYRQCERLVRGFNQLLQEAFQIENPLFIVIT